MTRDFATDPEVAEDLIHRARSERDRDRTGEFTFGDAAIVERWPCRKGCGALVGVTAAAISALETSNAMLRRAGKPPIGKHEVMWCPDCKRVDDDLAALQRGTRGPGSQTEIAGAAPAEERPSWMPTPRAERNRRRNNR